MSNLFWVTFFISSTVFSATPDYSKLVKELDRAEIRSGKVQEQYDTMVSSIKSANDAVVNLEKEITIKEQELNSKKVFAKSRIGFLLKHSAPERMDLLNAFDNVEETERVQVLLGKMLKQDVKDYNKLDAELSGLDDLKKLLSQEKQKLESQSKELSFYIKELKDSIDQKKKLLEKIRSSQTGSKILAERTKQSASKISGIMTGTKIESMKTPVDDLLKGLVAPLKGKIISAFGKVWDSATRNWIHNKGVRVESEYGKQVYAVDVGAVSYDGWIPGYGKVIIIKHGGGYFSVYGHLSKMLLNRGAKVSKGMVVGLVGDTGTVDIPSLYFEISTPTRNIDPTPLFN